jgi:hypothetical protein
MEKKSGDALERCTFTDVRSKCFGYASARSRTVRSPNVANSSIPAVDRWDDVYFGSPCNICFASLTRLRSPTPCGPHASALSSPQHSSARRQAHLAHAARAACAPASRVVSCIYLSAQPSPGAGPPAAVGRPALPLRRAGRRVPPPGERGHARTHGVECGTTTALRGSPGFCARCRPGIGGSLTVTG